MDSEKLLFYEALLQQLQDDGLDDAITCIKEKLKIEPNVLLRKNHLFELFRNTAYLSTRVVSGVESKYPDEIDHNYQSRLLTILNEAHTGEPTDPLLKVPCRCIAESNDGTILATGGQGGALHIIPTVDGNQDTVRRKPNWQLTTRLNGHHQDIEALDFHPRRNIIASGGVGHNIIIHDINTSNGFVHSVTDIHFMYVGTDSSIIRLFDITTRSCFTSNRTRIQHQGGGINDCDVIRSGGLLFTAGEDGSVLVWDGKSLDVLHAFESVHGGTSVLSVNCDKSGMYIVSSGKDGSTKVMDIRMMREIASVSNLGRGELVRTRSGFMLNNRYIATFTMRYTGRRPTNEVQIHCVDTGAQEADITSIVGRSSIMGMYASKHDLALYLLLEDATCKVVNIFDPSA
eukprot:XP_001610204.1 WD domain, G-beta repeat containing protein [Babesia bovis T2Bo]